MRYPIRRIRNTVTYLSVAFLGTAAERAACRRQVGRAHAAVRSTASSPVSYSAFDPRLQLWVAACLYRGVADMHALLHGPIDDAAADAVYRDPPPVSAALGPVNRFLTTGFLPPPFREQMRLRWTRRDQRQFDLLMRTMASVNRVLPAPISRFPFNACLQDLRTRIAWDRGRRALARRLARGFPWSQGSSSTTT